MKRLYKNILALASFITACLIMPACSDDAFDAIIANENNYSIDGPASNIPLPGNNGLIQIFAVTHSSATIQWTPAVDNSSAELLRYQVVVSDTYPLFLLEEIIRAGLLIENNWSNQPVYQVTIANLTRGRVYSVNVCVMDPDGAIAVYYPASFRTIGRIYLFSAGRFDGGMGRGTSLYSMQSVREALNDLCKTALQTNQSFSHLPRDNVAAFISIDANDSISAIPAHYPDFPLDWPIYSPSGSIIAYNWHDLVDGSINIQLQRAGATDGFWWSGSLSDGSWDTDTCNGWTHSTNASLGRSGAHNRENNEWMHSNNRNCNNELTLLGLSW